MGRVRRRRPWSGQRSRASWRHRPASVAHRGTGIEQTLMILPLPCSIKIEETAWLISNAAVRFTATIGSHRLRSNSRTSSTLMPMPALFTTMSTPPSVSTQSFTTSAGVPLTVRSAVTISQRRPSASISSLVVPSSAATVGMCRSAPAFAMATAYTWPRPRLPPVTIAFLPRQKKSSEKSRMCRSVTVAAPSSGAVRARSFTEQTPADRQRRFVEADEDDLVGAGRGGSDGIDRDGRSQIGWIAIDAGRDRRTQSWPPRPHRLERATPGSTTPTVRVRPQRRHPQTGPTVWTV